MKKNLINHLLLILLIFSTGCVTKDGKVIHAAVDDVASVEMGQSINIDVLKNDNSYGLAKSIKSVSTPLHGTAVIENNNTITYTPTNGFSGTDSFTYIVQASTYTDTAKVTVTVINPTVPNNQPPTANAGVDKRVAASESVTLTGNDNDTDGNIISREWKEGAVSLAQTQSFNYTSTDVGIHTLIYTVTDNDGASASDEVDVNVTATIIEEDHKPIANTSTVSMNSDCSINKASSFTLTGSDADGDDLTFTKTTNPTYGVVTVNNDGSGTFILNNDEAVAKCTDEMANSFNFKVNDGTINSDETRIDIIQTLS